MKKFLLLPLLICGVVKAEQEIDIKKAAEEAGVVIFKMILYKNRENHNAQAWQEAVIQRAIDCIKKFDENNAGGGIDAICSFAKGLQEYAGDATGIHGEITISTGDGRCPQGCCAHEGSKEQCACLDRYAGMCPCSAEINNRTCGKVGCRNQVEEAEKCTTCGKPKPPVAKEEVCQCDSAKEKQSDSEKESK
jgi:hypothetical protein